MAAACYYWSGAPAAAVPGLPEMLGQEAEENRPDVAGQRLLRPLVEVKRVPHAVEVNHLMRRAPLARHPVQLVGLQIVDRGVGPAVQGQERRTPRLTCVTGEASTSTGSVSACARCTESAPSSPRRFPVGLPCLSVSCRVRMLVMP